VLTISAAGLNGGLRQARDGVTYFGAFEKHRGKTVNDFIIPVRKNTPGDNKGRFFSIKYSTEASSYLIRDMDNGFGTFVKLEDTLKLRDNHLL
jgi:hypothetical protein